MQLKEGVDPKQMIAEVMFWHRVGKVLWVPLTLDSDITLDNLFGFECYYKNDISFQSTRKCLLDHNH